MITLTPIAVAKSLEIMSAQNQRPIGLRLGVVGGGCSGFQYHMAFEANDPALTDSVFEFGENKELKVLIDQMSMMYLDGVEIDYVETLEGSGFKFNNPNVKAECGCGKSFTL